MFSEAEADGVFADGFFEEVAHVAAVAEAAAGGFEFACHSGFECGLRCGFECVLVFFAESFENTDKLGRGVVLEIQVNGESRK